MVIAAAPLCEASLDIAAGSCPEGKGYHPQPEECVSRMLRSAPHLRRGALLIRDPFAGQWVPALRSSAKRRCTASGTRRHCFTPSQDEVGGRVEPAEVKNFVPSKKRFGRLNMEMNVAPLGACATWMLPPGRHTKSPAPQLPSASSSDPSSMKVCSSALCSCNGTTAPGAILNRMVERPSPSWYRIFISMPSNSVRCQAIDDAATKVERSSGGLTGEGLFMASSPLCLGDLVDRHLVRDAAQRHVSGRWLQPVGLKQGPGIRVLHHRFRHHDRA